MSLLLDTHYVFAIAGSPGTLTSVEREFLQSFKQRFVVSAVSIWEIRLKWHSFHRSGTGKGPKGPGEIVHILSSQPIYFLALSPAHAATVLELPLLHKDPFDELLLAQAQSEGLSLFSRDRALAGHPLVTSL